MQEIAHKTQDGPMWRDMDRIYVACLPEDREKYLRRAYTQILRGGDRVVFYEKGSTDGGDEEPPDVLYTAHLMVVLVSARTLSGHNYVKDQAVPIARANMIPILAILYEGGLEEAFIARFGDMPHIHAVSEEGSPIRYRAALEERLQAMLPAWGDERPGRREEMRRIFSLSRSMLHSEDEEEREEAAVHLWKLGELGFPDAMDTLAGMYLKGIGVETDAQIAVQWGDKYCDFLEKRYRTSGCTGDGAALLHALWCEGEESRKAGLWYQARSTYERMRSMSIKVLAQTGSQIACRYMALASGGMGDVCQAEGDILGAREQKAEQWDILVRLASKKVTRYVLEDLFLAALEMAAIFKIQKDIPELKAWYMKAAEVGKAWLKRGCNTQETMAVGQVCAALGDLCSDGYMAFRALEWYEEARMIYDKIPEAEWTVQIMQEMLYVLGAMADASGDLGDEDGYQRWSSRSKDFCQQIVARLGRVEGLRSIADICAAAEARSDLPHSGYTSFLWNRRLGTVLERLVAVSGSEEDAMLLARTQIRQAKFYDVVHDYAHGKGSLDSAIEILKDIQGLQAQYYLSMAYETYGSIQKGEGAYDEALERYEMAARLGETIREETGDVQALSHLATIFQGMSDLCKARDDLPGAIHAAGDTVSVLRQIVAEGGGTEEQMELARVYMSLRDLYQKTGDLEGAVLWAGKAQKICADLATDGCSIWEISHLADCCEHLGELYLERGDLDLAQVWFEEQMRALERKTALDNGPGAKFRLSGEQGRLGARYMDIGEPALALPWYQKAAEICAELAEEPEDGDEGWNLFDALLDLGCVYRAMHDIPAAERCYAKGIEIGESLLACGDEYDFRALSEACLEMGFFHILEKDPRSAESWICKSQSLREELLGDEMNDEDRHFRSRYLFAMYSVHCSQGQIQEARDWLGQAIILVEDMVAEKRDPADMHDLVVFYGEMSALCEDEGDGPGAQAWNEKYLELRSQIEGE